jgi:uncharacterized protein DUF4260
LGGSNTAISETETALSREFGGYFRSFWRYKATSDSIRKIDMSDAQEMAGTATGGVKILLRLEGLVLFLGMVLLYDVWSGSWWVFAILFLVPDLSFLAYLADAKTGAIVYNAAHSYLAPVALMTLGFAIGEPLTLSIAMIWLAHIGIDRALGYGLKYATGFGYTHLSRFGKATGAP